MTSSLGRIWRVAVTELAWAMRSRRALVVTLLFVAIAALMMYGTITAFAAMEREALSALGLPPSNTPGSVTTVLWKSKPFMHIIDKMVGDNLVFDDICGRHPIALAFAMFLFQVIPLLTLLVSAPRIADDLRSGTARYWLVRVTRVEWSLGKFFGEAMMLVFAVLAGALSAWAVAFFRMPGTTGAELLPAIVDWSLRAWMYAFGWLGLFMGLSHVVTSGGKATALGILAMLGVFAWRPMLSNILPESGPMASLSYLDALIPPYVQPMLWRRSPGVLFSGVVHLSALSFLYLSLGSCAFRRRDV